MALQTKTLTSEKTLGYQLQLILQEESVSAAEGVSVVPYTLVLTSGAYDFAMYSIGWNIQFNGETVSSCARSEAKQLSLGTYSRVTVATGVAKVAHDADGGLTLTVSASIDMAKTGYTPGDMSLAGTMKMTDIARVSSVSAANGYIGSPIVISIKRQSTSFTHKLTYRFGAVSGTIAEKVAASSVSWTPPMDLCKQLPDSVSGTCTITCETYSGSKKVGEDSCTAKLSVPSSVKLTLNSGWVSVTPKSANTVVCGWGIFLAGYSQAEVTVDETKIGTEKAYGADIAEIRIAFDGTDLGPPYLTPVLQRAGKNSVVCIVTDTRGRSQTHEIGFTVEAYAAPKILEAEVYRCNAQGEPDRNGLYYYAKASASCSSVGGLNQLQYLRIRHKIGDAADYGDGSNLSDGVGAVFGNGSISAKHTYAVQIYTKDTLGRYGTYVGRLLSKEAFFRGRAGSKGAAFGKTAEEDDLLDIAWNERVRKNLTVDGDIIIGGKSLKSLLGIT